MIRCVLSILILVVLSASDTRAQGDLETQRASLRGIDEFFVDVTVEGPEHLVESDQLRRDVVAYRIVHRIREGGLPVQQAPRGRDMLPNLHIHVNMLEVDRGLIPFAVAAGFYQQVRVLDNEREMSAATWTESVLGLVSGDLLATIPQSVDTLVDQFIEDFGSANE